MTQQQAEKLKQLWDEGMQIKVQSHYVDSFVYSIHEKDGQICYSSEVYSNVSLLDVSLRDVSVYREIQDWYKS